MFTVSVRSELADWQEVISAPDHVLVLVECSVVDNSDRRSAHAMYGIGAEQGKFIFMNTWGRLDLRAVDESWLRNGRIKFRSVSVDLRQNGIRVPPAFGPAVVNIPNRRHEPPIGKGASVPSLGSKTGTDQNSGKTIYWNPQKQLWQWEVPQEVGAPCTLVGCRLGGGCCEPLGLLVRGRRGHCMAVGRRSRITLLATCTKMRALCFALARSRSL